MKPNISSLMAWFDAHTSTSELLVVILCVAAVLWALSGRATVKKTLTVRTRETGKDEV